MPVKYNSEMPEIYMPLEKLDKCAVCQESEKALRWCSSCGEVLYCSTECQKSDWKKHKADCGQTDRIEIDSFFQLIAAVQQACHFHPEAIKHPALLHKIVNSPNPGSQDNIASLPNGASARLVLLGDRIHEHQVSSPTWWPTAISQKVRSKLMRRITGEGLLLPIVLSTTLALIGEMYTTTAVPAAYQPEWQFTGRRRVRLQYNRVPIADIGVAKGTCTRVTGQDRLCYYNIDTNEFLMGQDPTDHYWIYFTTLEGKEYFLDCGMFTFNFTSMINISKVHMLGLPPLEWVPAFYYTKDLAKALPTTPGGIGWNPDQRFSLLRHKELNNSIRRREEYCRCHDMPVLLEWLDKIANRACTSWEKDMFLTFFENSSIVFRLNLKNRTYLNFPKEPALGFELDPEESLADDHPGESQALEKYLKKWTRRLNKGQISPKQWNKAFNRWKEKPYDERMRMSGISNIEKSKQHGSSCDETSSAPTQPQTSSITANLTQTTQKDNQSQEMQARMHELGKAMAQQDINETVRIFNLKPKDGQRN